MSESTNTAPARRGVPLWVQILIWVVLLGLLLVFAGSLGLLSFLGINSPQQPNVQPGTRIPDFSMPLFSGYELNGNSQLDITSLRGKVVMINFWASWCKPCEQEAADLRQAWDFYKDGGKVVFIGVDYVDTEPEARAYLQKFGITYANGPDLGTKVSQMFRIKGVPETYFLDQEGVLRHVQVGPFTSVNDIKSVIDPMVH
jgi:cytochrome c biogenesis protein CcmG/thiol:disulfide interchange protein DsbE